MIVTFWNQLSPETQTAIITGVVSGVALGPIAWLVQWLWTHCKLPGPCPDTTTIKKKLVALAIAATPALILWATSHSAPEALSLFVGLLGGSQATHSLAAPKASQ